MGLPEFIADVLGCPATLDSIGFREHLEAVGDAQLPWFLAGDDPKTALVESLFQDDSGLLAYLLPESYDNPRALYYRATDSGAHTYSLVAFGAPNVRAEDFPTAALVALARAWPKFPALVEVCNESPTESQDADETLVGGTSIALPTALAGKALVLRKEGLASPDSHANIHPVLIALAGLRVEAKALEDPQWLNFKVVDVKPGGLVHRTEMMSGNLLQEALCETRPRWRFIALYRVFESAYLLSVRDAFLKNFFENPKGATSNVGKALESELSQFKEVVQLHGLQAYFEEILNEANAIAGNSLLVAVKEEIDAEKNSQAPWQVGVSYVYKLRCSIVHAGQKYVVIDRYSDGNAALVKLMPSVEKAVLALLGLSVS